MILLDTHVVVWLYEGDFKPIPAEVQRRIDSESLAVSPCVELELAYLYEVGRITPTSGTIMGELRSKLELQSASDSLAAVCEAAKQLKWTRDPFDRLISAHASAMATTLVTRDRTIRANLPLAWWGS